MMARKSAAARRRWRTRFAQIAVMVGVVVLIVPARSMQPANALVRSTWNQPGPVDSVKFDTDACGRLAGVNGGRLIPKESSATDESRQADGDADSDEENWVSAWGMSAEASALAEEWIWEHPQVAIITDAVQKSCDADAVEDSDTGTFGVA